MIARLIQSSLVMAAALCLGPFSSNGTTLAQQAKVRFSPVASEAQAQEVVEYLLQGQWEPEQRWRKVLDMLQADPEHLFALDLLDSIPSPPPGGEEEATVHELISLRSKLVDARAAARIGELLKILERRSAASGMPLDLGEDLFPTWLGQFWSVGPLGPLTDPEPLWSRRDPANDPEAKLQAQYTTNWGTRVKWQPLQRSPRKATVPGDQQTYRSGGCVFLLGGTRLEQGRGYLDLATSASVRVLWNGEEVFYRKVGGLSKAGNWFRVPVHFREGINQLLLVTDGSNWIEVGARLLDEDLRPVTPQQISLEELLQTPPAQEAGLENSGPNKSALWGPVQNDPRSAVPDIGYGQLLEAIRATQRGRADLALGMEAPPGIALRPLWLRLRHTALSYAEYLPAEVQRQRMLQVEQELQELDSLGRTIMRRQISRLLREDKPLEAAALLESMGPRDMAHPIMSGLTIDVARALDSQGSLARKAIEQACARWPNDPQFQALLAESYMQAGNEVLAREHAVTALRMGSRNHATVALAAMGLAHDPSDGRRTWLLATLERWAELDRTVWDLEALLQETLVTLGQRDLALERALRHAQANTEDIRPWAALLELANEAGQTFGDSAFDLALGQLERLEPATENLAQLRRSAEQPVASDAFFKAFAPDMEFAWQSATELEKASTVEVLDSGLVYLYPDGSRLGRIHTITKAVDRTGTEKLHQLAANGSPLVARVIKADGSTREPVQVQEAWVMPSLDPGDAVELQYEWEQVEAWGAPFDLDFWRFASSERPFGVSRYVVYVPDGLAVELRTRNFVGNHETESWSGGTVHILTAERCARVEGEPLMPSGVEILPVAQFALDRSLEPIEQDWRNRLQVSEDLPLELEQGLDRWVAQMDPKNSPMEQAQALFAKLGEELVEFDGPAEPAQVWFAKRGQPILLYANLLKRAGIPYEWGLMEKGISPELDPNPVALFKNLDGYQGLILRIGGAGETDQVRWQIPPNSKGSAFAQLPAQLGGVRVLVLEQEGTRFETLPREPVASRWQPHLRLHWTVEESGAAQAEGTWSILSTEGATLRRQLAQAAAPQRDAFARQVISAFVPGLDLKEHELLDLNVEGAPMRLRFTGTRPDFVEASEDPAGPSYRANLRLRGAELSTSLGPAQRNWPLAARLARQEFYEVTLSLPAGWSVVGGPQPIVEERDGFLHRLRIDAETDQPWRLERTFHLRGMHLEAAEVPAFLERCAQIEREEARPLLIQRVGEAGATQTTPAQPGATDSEASKPASPESEKAGDAVDPKVDPEADPADSPGSAPASDPPVEAGDGDHDSHAGWHSSQVSR